MVIWTSRVNISSLSVRERLKEVLRLYELRERHFECVIRSKELEVLLSRARAAEQRQLAEGEKARADKLDEEVGFCFSTDVTCIRRESTILITSHSFTFSRSVTHAGVRPQNHHLKKDLEEAQNGHSMFVERLITYCKEVSQSYPARELSGD